MASVSFGDETGWRSVVLESAELRVVVLPDKGAEIHRLVHRESDVDVLFKGPWGLQPPGAPPLEGSGDDEFMLNYAGGWQELFPSVNEACTYRGRHIPFHGEVATLPWQYEVLSDSGVRFTTRCRETSFELERTLSVDDAKPELEIESVATNVGDEPAHFVWGQHCVLGAPLLEDGCTLELPARTIVTRPELWEPETAALVPGQLEAWPNALLREGGTTDLREIPGPERRSHDDIYVGDLEATWLAVSNPRLGLTFRLEWEPAALAWVILWQAYGGADAPPLTGSYALGVEPWTSRLNLEAALASGEAIELAPGGRFTTRFSAGVTRALSETG
jgi:galactose mutarotase-like enzyme